MSPIDVSTTLKRRGCDATTTPMATIAANATKRFSSRLLVLDRLWSTKRTACLFQQIGFDKRIEVAIEHPVYIANLHLRAVIFDHLIGLEHVTANLASKTNLFLGAGDLLEL